MRHGMVVAIALTTGCVVVEGRVGNGVEATEVREVGAFDGIASELSIEVAAAEGDAHVEVTCDENLLEAIETVVEGGVLHVRAEPWTRLDPRADCHVWVQTPTIERAVSAGSARLIVTGDRAALTEVVSSGSGGVLVEAAVAGDELSVASTGSGPVEVDDVRVGLLSVTSAGSGDTELHGASADRIELRISGSGSVRAAGVVADEVDATLSGSGGGEVTAAEALTATLTGSGSLLVYGHPSGQDVTDSGSGSVRLE